jgi:hypothetical protein
MLSILGTAFGVLPAGTSTQLLYSYFDMAQASIHALCHCFIIQVSDDQVGEGKEGCNKRLAGAQPC